MQKKCLIHYLRDSNRVPFGCVVAISPNEVGFSICNSKDHFNKKMARNIALGRAYMRSLDDSLSLIPKKTIYGYYGKDTVRNETQQPVLMKEYVIQSLERVKQRAKKYFKEQN